MRCLGIDYGTKRVGLAHGDDQGIAREGRHDGGRYIDAHHLRDIARAVGTQKAVDTTVGHHQIKSVDRMAVAEASTQPLGFQTKHRLTPRIYVLVKS